MKKRLAQFMIVGSLSTSVLLSSIGTSVANIVLPSIATHFAVSFAAVRWVVLSYLLATTLFSLMVGYFGDLKGRRRILFFGAGLFFIGTLLTALSYSFEILIFSRVLQGVGGAALIVLPMAIATEVVSSEKIGRVIGLLATMSALGTATGPSLGGVLLGIYGWSAPFFLVALLGFLNFLLLMFFLPADGALVKPHQKGPRTLEVLASISSDPVLCVRLASNLVVSSVMMATLISGPFYLARVLKISPSQMGLVMSTGPLTSVCFGILSGFFVDRFGVRAILKFGLFQLMVGAICFAVLPSLFGAGGFAFSSVMLSIGYQMFLSANSSCIMKKQATDRRGLVSGALSLSRNVGLMSGTLVLGGIFDRFGLRVTFVVAAVFVFALFLVQSKILKKEMV